MNYDDWRKDFLESVNALVEELDAVAALEECNSVKSRKFKEVGEKHGLDFTEMVS